MKARHLLTICVALITVSIFVIPGTVYIGIDKGIATDASELMLLVGILSAVLTVHQDAREGREIDDERRR